MVNTVVISWEIISFTEVVNLDKPTPAPRGRSSFGGQSGGVIHVRHSPSSSNQSTPFGSAHRPNHSNHSPLVRSREHTPNHSRQSSGNLLPRTPNSRNHDGLSVPNRVTEYPPSSSSGSFSDRLKFFVLIGWYLKTYLRRR